MNIDNILHHYMVCALWSSKDEDGNPLDDAYTLEDIAPKTREDMRSDVQYFVEDNEKLLISSGLSEAQIGHDFWLTRNGHGSGFWDRGLGVIGDRLADACRHQGVYLYVADDGLIWAD